jgi:phosphoglycolate phosphatase-like HAD superfamily hydrolase
MAHGWKMEIIRPERERGGFRFALFDFDGTLSLIREGWQGVMKGYFYEELSRTPGSAGEGESGIRSRIDDFVDLNTGKQTIYQCFALADEIARLGGTPQDPQIYKDEYQRRLLERVQHRITALEQGEAPPERYMVPGSFGLLRGLKERGASLFLASGTDERFAKREAEILNVSPYFEGRVYGARRDYKTFSKKMIVDRIISENGLKGNELLGFGDGFVEIENVKERGGFAVGVASDEKNRGGRVDEWKRGRLISAGADIIIPDYGDVPALLGYLFEEV